MERTGNRTSKSAPMDAFTAWQIANGEHVTEQIDGEEVLVLANNDPHYPHYPHYPRYPRVLG